MVKILTAKHGTSTNWSVNTRNLQTQDLGAVIFGCTNNTFPECHARQLFGLPRTHLSYVQNIKEGLPLFLFNYDNRRLHGIYEAASNGKFCPQSNAWSHNGKGKTSYPAQVAMRLKLWCFPLAESQFRNAILTNYYQRKPGVCGQFFHFELDHEQTQALVNMFTPLPSPYNTLTPPIAAPVHEHVKKSTSPPVCAAQFEGNSDVKSEKAVKPYADVVQKGILEQVGYVGVNARHASSNFECSSGANDLASGDTPSEGRDYTLSNKDAKVQQLQSGQQGKKLSIELEKLKAPSPWLLSSEFCANATATADIDTYSCKDAQEVKSTILGGPSNLREKFDAEVDQLSLGYSNPPVQSLDFISCTAAKMMNTGCSAVNELSPSLPAKTRQFLESETQLIQAVYETPKNSNDNGAPDAPDPAGQPQSHCAESTSIRPLTILSSQECMRDENSLRKGKKRKTPSVAIQRRPNGHDGIHNMHPTQLPSPDYTSWYVKDRLIGKITCMVCGKEGLYTCDCSMKDRENKVMCTLCNKVGHCYLWCCRQHVSENRACRRCGEKGHYTNKDLSHCDEKYTSMYVRCSSCDERHPLGRCPMGKVTCFLCEGKDHVPAHCRLSPMLTVTQFYRDSFRAILKQALTETSRRAVTPAKVSRELEPHDGHEHQFKRDGKMVHRISTFIHCEQGGLSVSDTNKTNHAALTEKALTRGSSSACFNCHEEGHYANRCPKKKPPGEQELHDITCFRFCANKSLKKKKKKTTQLELSQVTCFRCHEKGHYSFSCPANNPPGEFGFHDVTCISFNTNSCDWKKPPPELLCDVTCFKCYEKGHYSNSCPKNKSPGEGHSAKKCNKKKQKKEQQK